MDASRESLVNVLNDSRDGIFIADAQQRGFPLIYVNRGFEALTGYTADEAVGKPFHMLQGSDTGQPETAMLRATMTGGRECSLTLRNYRKDGTMFLCQLSLFPLHNAEGAPTCFIGIQKAVADNARFDRQPDRRIYTDPLTGIASRHCFDERLRDFLQAAQRIRSELAVLMVDLDHFRQFNERYGYPAGDECLRMVGGCIAKAFARASDCAARYGGEEFAIVSFSSGVEPLRAYARKLCEQVRALGIPHSDSPHGVVTISIGGIHQLPDHEETGEQLVALATRELLTAKRSGRDCVRIVGQGNAE